LRLSRRSLLAGAGAVALASGGLRASEEPIRFGLTPVFLDSDIELLARLERYLASRLNHSVSLVKRRTYQEITALLLSDQLHAAWICGFPFVQHETDFSLVAVPLWRGKPLYQSYLVVRKGETAQTIADLRGTVHAFSDPDSNSGFLVTRYLLATMRERPESYFARFFFTYGHRNVIRAVAAGLAQSGSVDGYIWEVVNELEPGLTAGTRIIRKSEPLGFPPVACSARMADHPQVKAIGDVLTTMNGDDEGRRLLATLHLDGFAREDPRLFDRIAEMYRTVLAQS
jgi:phosphonate transport system substrate-binding protein